MYFKSYIICNNYYARFYSKRCAGHCSRNNSYYDKRIATYYDLWPRGERLCAGFKI